MATLLTGMVEKGPMSEPVRNPPQAHICSKLLKLSCKVTKPFGFFVCLHFLLRNCLHENKVLNFPLEIEYIGFKSTTTELAVFFIGIYLFVLCGLSMFSLIHIICVFGAKRMKYLVLRSQALIIPIARRHILTVFFTPFSIYYSIWLFSFVRQKWSSNFAQPVQYLHLLPTCFFLLHTIAEVLVLMCTNAMMLNSGDHQLSSDDCKDLVTHVRKIGSVNTVFIVYCISILFIVFFKDLPSAIDTMAILFELFFRICFLSSTCCLEDKMEKFPIQVQEHTQEHTDEHTQERTDEHTQERTDELTQKRTDEHTQERTDKHTQEHTDEHTQERTDEHTQERTDEHTQERTDEHTQNVYVLPFSSGTLCEFGCPFQVCPTSEDTEDCCQWSEIIEANETAAEVVSALPEDSRAVFLELPRAHSEDSQAVFPELPRVHSEDSRAVFPELPRVHSGEH